MAYLGQKKLGPELITNSQEAWIGYYVFTALTLAFLIGGPWLIGRFQLEPGFHFLAMVGVLILALVSAGISIVCHIGGHLFDELAGMRKPPSSQTER